MKAFTFTPDDYNPWTKSGESGQRVINGYGEKRRFGENRRPVTVSYWHRPEDGEGLPQRYVDYVDDVTHSRQLDPLLYDDGFKDPGYGDPAYEDYAHIDHRRTDDHRTYVDRNDDTSQTKADEVITSVPESESKNGWYYPHELGQLSRWRPINNDPRYFEFYNSSQFVLQVFGVDFDGVEKLNSELHGYNAQFGPVHMTLPLVFRYPDGR